MLANNMSQGWGSNPSSPVTAFSEGPPADVLPWESSDPFFTASARLLVQRVLKCYVRQSIVCVGSPANALASAVFFKV
ncbi:hypothetical protein ACOMHN_032303 [Nucella lapillus]